MGKVVISISVFKSKGGSLKLRISLCFIILLLTDHKPDKNKNKRMRSQFQ